MNQDCIILIKYLLGRDMHFKMKLLRQFPGVEEGNNRSSSQGKNEKKMGHARLIDVFDTLLQLHRVAGSLLLRGWSLVLRVVTC